MTAAAWNAKLCMKICEGVKKLYMKSWSSGEGAKYASAPPTFAKKKKSKLKKGNSRSMVDINNKN